jgi:hypothetical protein
MVSNALISDTGHLHESALFHSVYTSDCGPYFVPAKNFLITVRYFGTLTERGF